MHALPSLILLAIQYRVPLAYFVSAIFFTQTEMKQLIRDQVRAFMEFHKNGEG